MISFDPIDLLERRQSGRTNVAAIVVGFLGVVLVAAAFVMWGMAQTSDEPITPGAVVENTAEFLGVPMPTSKGGATSYSDLLPQTAQGWDRFDYSSGHLGELLQASAQSPTDQFHYRSVREDFAASANDLLASYRSGSSVAVVRVKEHPFRFDATHSGTPIDEINTWRSALSVEFLPAIIHGVAFIGRQDEAGTLRTYRGSLDGYGVIEVVTNAQPAEVLTLIGQLPVSGIAAAMGAETDYISAEFGVILADPADTTLRDAMKALVPSVPDAPAMDTGATPDVSNSALEQPAVVVRNGGNGMNQTRTFGSGSRCTVVEGVRRCN